MKFSPFLAGLVFLVVTAEAGPPVRLTVERGRSGSLVLRGPDCKILERNVAVLRDWMSRKGGRPVKPAPTCRPFNEQVEMDLTGSVPDFYPALHGVCTTDDGPNCWNATLVASDILPALRYTSPSELSFWLRSPSCRRIDPGTPLEAGDVVALRSRDGDEVHAFIHVSNELSFSKNGFGREKPYLIQPSEDVFLLYGVAEACRERPPSDPKCRNYAAYYRCSGENLRKFRMSGASGSANPSRAYLESKVGGIEMRLSRCVAAPSPVGMTNAVGAKETLGRDVLNTMQDSLAAVELQARELIMSAESDDERLRCEALRLRARSLQEQIFILE